MAAPERIVAAARAVMLRDGFARATTKAIAAEAGCSEALIYKHFPDKTHVFVAVLDAGAPGLRSLLSGLVERAGTGSVRVTVQEVTTALVDFYVTTFPIAAGVFGDRRVLEGHRAGLRRAEAGPEMVNHAVAQYLEAEQAIGRLPADPAPTALAAALVGACFQVGFFAALHGTEPDVSTVHELVDALVPERPVRADTT